MLLGEFFGTVNWVLQAFAHDPQWRLQGEMGFLAVLHTWDQRLRQHFHLHCIVPGGVWRAAAKSSAADENGHAAAKPPGEVGHEVRGKWVPCRGRWLFRKDSLAAAFRNRFLKRLRALRRAGKLRFTGPAAALAAEPAWNERLIQLADCDWIVYPKAAPAGAETALDYLGRYSHRVAISDYRLCSLQDGRVTYRWRDRFDLSACGHAQAGGNRQKLDTLPAVEFTCRFCTHILPRGFRKIRYYGWLSAPRRRTTLPAIRANLHATAPEPQSQQTLSERTLQRTGLDITLCPHCRRGHFRDTGILIPPERGPPT